MSDNKSLEQTFMVDGEAGLQLFNDVCSIIDAARHHVAAYANAEVCMMNWNVGKRIKDDVLFNKRAEYGKQVLNHLSAKLIEIYGAGWGAEKLRHCVRSAYIFPRKRFCTQCVRN